MQPHVMKNQTQFNNVIPFIPEGDFYFVRGIKAFQRRKFDIALKWIEKAVEKVPNDPLYQCQMSIIYTEIGLYHKANEILTNVLHHAKEPYVDCFYLLANNYAHLGLLSDAKKYALTYIEKEPNGDLVEDAEELLEIIDIEEQDDWLLDDEDELIIYQETAFYYMETMNWEKALLLLEEMLLLFPEHPTANHDYAQALFFSGDKERAIQLELEYVQKNPTSLYCYTNLALFYYEIGEFSEYETYIRALLNIYPIHDHQKLKIAVVLARTGYIENACSRFQQLNKESVSGHLSYYRWYSHVLYLLGNEKKSMKIWEIGCKKHPIMTKEVQPWES